jgi:putative molybdopterin biosynthesis protein
LAIKKQTAHVAGSHLLDTETGDYNTSYIKRYVKGVPITLVNLVHRWQGFMVKAGNPKRISGITDLTRPDVTFINRQPGSGNHRLAGGGR